VVVGHSAVLSLPKDGPHALRRGSTGSPLGWSFIAKLQTRTASSDLVLSLRRTAAG